MTMEHFFTPYHCEATLPGKRLLVLAPHPDDEVFGCGATLAAMARSGAEIRVLVLTDGVLVHEFSNLPEAEAERQRQARIELRRSESLRAAKCLGYGEPEFMGWQDGGLLNDGTPDAQTVDAERIRQLKEMVQEWRPDLLLTPSVWEMHRDHRAVAQWGLLLLSCAPEKASLAFYEVGVPLLPTHFIDVTELYPIKEEAMDCFTSQLAIQAYAEQIGGLNRFRSYTLGPSVTHAEAFHLVGVEDLARFNEGTSPNHVSQALLQAERKLLCCDRKMCELESKSRRDLEAMGLELQQYKNSLSWRVTAPLRYLRRLVGSIRRSPAKR